MIQAGQRLAFPPEPVHRVGRHEVRREDFQCGALFVLAVGALRQPDFTHAAAAQQGNGLPHSEKPARSGSCGGAVCAPLLVVGAQQTFQLSSQAFNAEGAPA